ncbi:MAG: hypothetical protein RL219_357 [Actinomycetota bacterium]|jgi:pSer/pThr/pTyr-binding forkhead associated (FHA) protein
MSYVFCNGCGHRNPPSSAFCSACGAVLDATGEHTASLSRVPSEPAASRGGGPGAAVLVVRGGDQDGLRFPLSDRLTSLGRSVENDISLDDITVSRRHAVLEHTPDGYVVHDNGSLNGTYVNQRRITTGVIEHGDELQIGKFHFLFLLAAE